MSNTNEESTNIHTPADDLESGPARPATDWGREAIGLAMAGITGTADATQEAHA
jgi:hypothetical protein